jgi:hypothetical protein
MRKYNIGEIVLLIMALTVAFFVCSTIIGIIITGAQTTQINSVIREKLLDLIDTIAGAVIGVVATLFGQNKNDKT